MYFIRKNIIELIPIILVWIEISVRERIRLQLDLFIFEFPSGISLDFIGTAKLDWFVQFSAKNLMSHKLAWDAAIWAAGVRQFHFSWVCIYFRLVGDRNSYFSTTLPSSLIISHSAAPFLNNDDASCDMKSHARWIVLKTRRDSLQP